MLDMTGCEITQVQDAPQQRIEICTLRGHPQQRYLRYRPKKLHADTPLVITVHGISRNGREQIEQFLPWAERHQTAVLAPLFTKPVFRDYQRLGRLGRGERADLALIRMIDQTVEALGLHPHKVYLFGYSGGGQFVHRFAMAHPQRVAKIAVGAAGWYTYPDPTRKFPFGIRETQALPGVNFDACAFLRIPALVLVGERDAERDPALNRAPHIDRRQGTTRIERGQRWIEAMREAARAHGHDTEYRFELLPDSGHSFLENMQRGGMGDRVYEFFFEHPEEAN